VLWRILLSGPADVQGAQLSPDGRFVAYQSTESGRREIFVQAYPSAGARWSVSAEGGFSPQWRGDGREIYYISGSRLVAVDIQVEGSRVVPGVPRVLFDAPFAGIGRNFFVPSQDGQRFLAVLRVDQAADRAFTVELNWMSRLKR
jgi:eukaryotic-like serine/threonine-protein kinase